MGKKKKKVVAAPLPTSKLELAQPSLEAYFGRDGLSQKGGGERVELCGLKRNELHGEEIFEIERMFQKEEVELIIQMAEREGFVPSVQRETRECAHRDNGRIQFHSPTLARVFWPRISSFFPQNIDGKRPVGLSDNFRLYKFSKGQRFGMHIDDSVRTSTGESTMYTLLVYLNGGKSSTFPVKGGETVFYDHDSRPGRATVLLSFPPKAGSALAHIHGQHCLLHEGTAVLHGVKYLMRTDVCYA